MSTDGQGRPLSDDGQWAWNGTEWVPAAIGGDVPPVQAADPRGMVTEPSPFSRGAAAQVSQPEYPDVPTAAQPTPGYTPTPGYGGTPIRKRSPKPRIIAIAAVVVAVAVAIVLIATLTHGKASDPSGAYVCRVSSSNGTGVVTFTAGKNYSLSDGGKPGTYTKNANTLIFKDGGLDTGIGSYDKNTKTVKITLQGVTLTCKK